MRMHCIIFPHYIFVLQNLNIPIFLSKSTKVVWSHQDYSCFSKIKMFSPLSMPFCWDGLEKRNLQSPLWKTVTQTARTGSLETGQVCCQKAGGLGNLIFTQRTWSSGVPLLWKKAGWDLESLETSDPKSPTLRASWKSTRQSRSPSSLLFGGTIFMVFTENRSSN